jgi:hypothetical protein
LCLGETNETYERFIFNSRQKSDEESIDKYVTTLRKLAQTCNFCACLHDSLIRDRLVLGINDNATKKKLLQDRKLTLSKAIDICRSNETMKKQLKSLKQSNEDGINMVNSKTPEKSGTHEQPARGRCKYCNGTHPRPSVWQNMQPLWPRQSLCQCMASKAKEPTTKTDPRNI